MPQDRFGARADALFEAGPAGNERVPQGMRLDLFSRRHGRPHEDEFSAGLPKRPLPCGRDAPERQRRIVERASRLFQRLAFIDIPDGALADFAIVSKMPPNDRRRRSPDRAGMLERAPRCRLGESSRVAHACADDLLDHAFDQQAIQQVGLSRINSCREIAGGRCQSQKQPVLGSPIAACRPRSDARRDAASGEARHTAHRIMALRLDESAPACDGVRSFGCGLLGGLFREALRDFVECLPPKRTAHAGRLSNS